MIHSTKKFDTLYLCYFCVLTKMVKELVVLVFRIESSLSFFSLFPDILYSSIFLPLCSPFSIDKMLSNGKITKIEVCLLMKNNCMQKFMMLLKLQRKKIVKIMFDIMKF